MAWPGLTTWAESWLAGTTRITRPPAGLAATAGLAASPGTAATPGTASYLAAGAGLAATSQFDLGTAIVGPVRSNRLAVRTGITAATCVTATRLATGARPALEPARLATARPCCGRSGDERHPGLPARTADRHRGGRRRGRGGSRLVPGGRAHSAGDGAGRGVLAARAGG